MGKEDEQKTGRGQPGRMELKKWIRKIVGPARID